LDTASQEAGSCNRPVVLKRVQEESDKNHHECEFSILGSRSEPRGRIGGMAKRKPSARGSDGIRESPQEGSEHEKKGWRRRRHVTWPLAEGSILGISVSVEGGSLPSTVRTVKRKSNSLKNEKGWCASWRGQRIGLGSLQRKTSRVWPDGNKGSGFSCLQTEALLQIVNHTGNKKGKNRREGKSSIRHRPGKNSEPSRGM